MSNLLCKDIILDENGKPFGHIPVDEWDTEKYPISDNDRIFREIRNEIILPVAEFFEQGDDDKKSLDYFVLSPRRTYKSDGAKEHICRYLNYFEKFYDENKILLAIIYKIKINIDYFPEYDKNEFINDINRYIIQNNDLLCLVMRFVNDNYMMSLHSGNTNTPNLQFEDRHAKVLYEISLLMNMYIPLSMHFMYVHGIRKTEDIYEFMLKLFDLCNTRYKEVRNIDIYNKIYETSMSVVNKSLSPDKVLWEKSIIRGHNATTHITDSTYDVILNIIPKYTYDKNIISFIYSCNRMGIRYKITDVPYEYVFTKLSSSIRDADQNSEYDKHEARLNKRNEALAMQNRVAAEAAVRNIEALYGPFLEDEIEHYKRKLTRDGAPVINSLQKQLVGYLYYKDFGAPITMESIGNQIDYLKLLISAKRNLKMRGMVLLPYIISSKVLRVTSRKVINKRDMIRIRNSDLYPQLMNKYGNNPLMEQKICELIGTINSSSYEAIDWDEKNNTIGEDDGKIVPIEVEKLTHEMLLFITMI